MPKLTNYTFNVAVVNDTYFEVQKLNDGTLVGLAGPCYLLIKTLAYILGFKYRLNMPVGNTYGNLNKNGTWDGVYEMILNGESDFVANTMFVTYECLQEFSFSHYCEREALSYLTKKTPTYQDKDVYFIVHPFHNSLWILLISFILFFPLTLQLFDELVLVCRLSNNHNDIVKNLSLWHIIAFIIGSKQLEKIDSIKNVYVLTIAFLLIFTGCILVFYSSMLSATVSNSGPAATIDTVKDLLEAVRYKNVSIGKNWESTVSLLKLSPRKDFQSLGRTLEKSGLYSNVEGWKAINNSNFAYITYIKDFSFHMTAFHKGYSLREIHIPKEPLSRINLAMMYSRSFQFKNIFSNTLLRILSAGIMGKLIGVDVKTEYEETKATKHASDIVYIDMADLYAVFLSLFLVYCLAAVVLILECVFKR